MDDAEGGGQRQEPTGGRIAWLLLGGLVASQAVGGALCFLLRLVPEVAVLVGFVPVLMGLVSAFVWRSLSLSAGSLIGLSLVETGVGLCLAALFLREGTVCLVIAAPLVWLFVLLGLFLGRYLFSPQTPRGLSATIAPALVAAVVVDGLTRHGYASVVETRRTLPAPPAALFPHVVALGPIEAPPTFWLCRLGLPAPERVSVQGARRDCVFTGNLVFAERITERLPDRRLTFEITRQPDHPEILGHARVRWGQMELIDRGDGTTTLVGRSGYTLYVHPGWYFDRWAQAIGHAVHERVFDQIERLATE